ncbi:MAG: alpha-galactosidase, partial [Anaerolineales bacterium]
MPESQSVLNTRYSSPITTPADMAQSRDWAKQHLAKAADLPISFRLAGRLIRGLPDSWQPTVRARRLDANIIETVFDGTDPQTGLNVRVECAEYRDYPVVEWVAWLTNTGSAATPLIADVRGLDADFEGLLPVLHHSNGDFASAEGYTSRSTPLPQGEFLEFAPAGGRACDQAFPYFRIAFARGGLCLAIGWPAQWAARFNGLAEGVSVRAGQELTQLRLQPGETIRTPRMTVLTWAGDEERAVNLWRRWYLAHILPRPDGRPMRPLLACAATDEGEEFTAATEANQIAFIEKFNQHGIRPDVWWIDAGWYPCYNAEHARRWPVTGSWRPDPERFPNGLKPISDRAAELGADLLTWFEPERVAAGTELYVEHPEWLLKVTGKTRESLQTAGTTQDGLLNLGNPAARQWLTDHVCGVIQENGIK